MTPISPFLRRYAYAILLGALLATLAITLVPAAFYDVHDFPLADPGVVPGFPGGVTPATLIANLLMPLFFFLICKELWESLVLKRGSLHGWQALGPVAMAAGGILGAVLVWHLMTGLIETADEAADKPGWILPFGSDLVLTFIFGRVVYGRGHPALQLLLLLCGMTEIAGLLAAGVLAPAGGTLQPFWLLLPLGASMVGYLVLTRPTLLPASSEVAHQRAFHLWPWLSLGALCWLGVAASGLPPALGLLPLLPAMPHADRSYGLFAEVEGFLSDPLNRFGRLVMRPLIAVMFLFGLSHGGVDLRGFAPTTWVALAALVLGKPLGMLIAAEALRIAGRGYPSGLARGDIVVVAGLCAVGFTGPALILTDVLPGGAMQEAARLGLGLSLLAGPAVAYIARARLHRTAA